MRKIYTFMSTAELARLKKKLPVFTLYLSQYMNICRYTVTTGKVKGDEF